MGKSDWSEDCIHTCALWHMRNGTDHLETSGNCPFSGKINAMNLILKCYIFLTDVRVELGLLKVAVIATQGCLLECEWRWYYRDHPKPPLYFLIYLVREELHSVALAGHTLSPSASVSNSWAYKATALGSTFMDLICRTKNWTKGLCTELHSQYFLGVWGGHWGFNPRPISSLFLIF